MENEKTFELKDENLGSVAGGMRAVSGKPVNADDSCRNFCCASCDGTRPYLWSNKHYCVVYDIDGADAKRPCTCENCKYYVREGGIGTCVR